MKVSNSMPATKNARISFGNNTNSNMMAFPPLFLMKQFLGSWDNLPQNKEHCRWEMNCWKWLEIWFLEELWFILTGLILEINNVRWLEEHWRSYRNGMVFNALMSLGVFDWDIFCKWLHEISLNDDSAKKALDLLQEHATYKNEKLFCQCMYSGCIFLPLSYYVSTLGSFVIRDINITSRTLHRPSGS